MQFLEDSADDDHCHHEESKKKNDNYDGMNEELSKKLMPINASRVSDDEEENERDST